jgi:hypothetical protein
MRWLDKKEWEFYNKFYSTAERTSYPIYLGERGLKELQKAINDYYRIVKVKLPNNIKLI